MSIEPEIELKKTTVRLSIAQLEVINQRAKSQNMTLNNYFIERALNENPVLDPAEREVRDRVWFELGRLRINLDTLISRKKLGAGNADLGKVLGRLDKALDLFNSVYRSGNQSSNI